MGKRDVVRANPDQPSWPRSLSTDLVNSMMPVHGRSQSPDSSNKRFKRVHIDVAPGLVHSIDPGPTEIFAEGLFNHKFTTSLHAKYVSNEPFKYAVVDQLIQDDLLKRVKDELQHELNFTKKETDIYKVKQTGDLASLNYLDSAQIALFPNLLKLRNSLYSSKFRHFLQTVTGCGPLSGKKQDMSANSYTKGCHLLNHDDAIGTRRLSYILYMPLPFSTSWKKEWGGALELYPTKKAPDCEPEPETAPSKLISPSWNQFIFFEVQPGRSFHSVQEVVAGDQDGDDRERLSISGWFHAPQEGEEGYNSGTSTLGIKSSRDQLTCTSTAFKSYSPNDPPPILDTVLSEHDKSFLTEFLNPVYLQMRTIEALSSRFVEESSLELHSFLSGDLANALYPRLLHMDASDDLHDSRGGLIPPHNAGTEGPWMTKGPPHKWRYCVLKPLNDDAPASVVRPLTIGSLEGIIRTLQNDLFPSRSFRTWLALVTRLVPMSYVAEARRFRPGLDYTLATSDDDDARLDVVLGLTPDLKDGGEDGSAAGPPNHRAQDLERQLRPAKGWQAAEWGGWECYMAPHNEEDDPAIYRAGNGEQNAFSRTSCQSFSNGNPSAERRQRSLPSSDEEMDGDDDSTLLTVQPGYNRLLLVLRDARVMRFVKYVSAAAEGSRWDVCGEFEVGMVAEEENDE